jgi:hypothetical protein
MDGIAAWGKNQGIKSLTDVSERPKAGFTIVLPGVFDYDGAKPIQIGSSFE